MEFTEEQQKFVDELVGNARISARTKAEAKFESAQTEANEEAERATLATRGEWEKLLTKSDARVKSLEPLEAKVEVYEVLIEGMLKDKVKALGEMAKKAIAALPETMSSLEKLGWLNQNEELFQEETRIVGTPAARTGLRRGKKTAKDVGHVRKKM